MFRLGDIEGVDKAPPLPCSSIYGKSLQAQVRQHMRTYIDVFIVGLRKDKGGKLAFLLNFFFYKIGHLERPLVFRDLLSLLS